MTTGSLTIDPSSLNSSKRISKRLFDAEHFYNPDDEQTTITLRVINQGEEWST
jgi:hypothetical protein